MAETVEERRRDHIRGVTVTTLASVAGVLAGLLAGQFAAGSEDVLGVAFLGLAIFVQFPIYRAAGIEVETFGAKDYLYVMFMTFCFWFVTWGIMLTTGSELGI